jgi:hypothetical protein
MPLFFIPVDAVAVSPKIEMDSRFGPNSCGWMAGADRGRLKTFDGFYCPCLPATVVGAISMRVRDA